MGQGHHSPQKPLGHSCKAALVGPLLPACPLHYLSDRIRQGNQRNQSPLSYGMCGNHPNEVYYIPAPGTPVPHPSLRQSGLHRLSPFLLCGVAQAFSGLGKPFQSPLFDCCLQWALCLSQSPQMKGDPNGTVTPTLPRQHGIWTAQLWMAGLAKVSTQEAKTVKKEMER